MSAADFQASDYDKVMQIDRFIKGEELKEELEAMDGYDQQDWTLLKKIMQEIQGETYTSMKYTIQDLKKLSE